MVGTESVDGPSDETVIGAVRIPSPMASVCLRALETTVEFVGGFVRSTEPPSHGARRLAEAAIDYASVVDKRRR
jgi:hypothetical protein